MAFGVDYSAGVPSTTSLLAQKVSFVARYLAPYLNGKPNPKCITKHEADLMGGAGIAVVLVFESWAKRALDGWNAGVSDAATALVQARALGFKDGPVYFAVDFDATPQQQGPINDYLMGAASHLGKSRVGVYGGFYVVKRALDAGACKYAWQTSAWSGGQWDPRIHIKQLGGGHIGGVAVDYDWSQQADYGQYLLGSPVTPPKPTPAPTPTPSPVPTPVPSQPLPRPDTSSLRAKLREWILYQKSRGLTWAQLQRTHAWKFWRALGGK